MSRRGSIHGRLERLEGRVGSDNGVNMAGSPNPDVVAVLDAYGDLKALMSDRGYRGGVPVAPVNRAAEVYGPRYTQEQFRELAIRTGLEARGYAPEEVAERVPGFLEFFGMMDEALHIGAVD